MDARPRSTSPPVMALSLLVSTAPLDDTQVPLNPSLPSPLPLPSYLFPSTPTSSTAHQPRLGGPAKRQRHHQHASPHQAAKTKIAASADSKSFSTSASVLSQTATDPVTPPSSLDTPSVPSSSGQGTVGVFKELGGVTGSVAVWESTEALTIQHF